MTTKEKIKVLIVDDHQVVRQGLRTFLELNQDINVIGEAINGEDAIQKVRQLSPHVVLMDLVMPIMDGIEATRQIKARGSSVKVIALTSFAEDDKVFPAIQAGASSYLLKDVSPDELLEAIRAAYRGEPRLHPNIARKLMEQISSPSNSTSKPHFEELTDRELDVVRLVANGCNNLQIAKQLVISEKTVKTHVSNVLAKLNLDDRTQLAIYAIKNKLVGQE
jgi:NarL family two-component system response regulator LiaR